MATQQAEAIKDSCMFSTFGPRDEDNQDCVLCHEPIEAMSHSATHSLCGVRLHDLCWQQCDVRRRVGGGPSTCVWCRKPLSDPLPTHYYFRITFDQEHLYETTETLVGDLPLEHRLMAEVSNVRMAFDFLDDQAPTESTEDCARRILPFLLGASSFKLYDFLDVIDHDGRPLVYALALHNGTFSDLATLQDAIDRVVDSGMAAIGYANRQFRIHRADLPTRVWRRVKKRVRGMVHNTRALRRMIHDTRAWPSL